jgi:hypothetical protein
MTAQINDVFCYRDSAFDVSAISDGEIFDISLLGLMPMATCTACWRGYQAIFAVADSHLVLDGLNINFMPTSGDPDQLGPVINGVAPNPPDRETQLFDNYYESLNYHLEYSGGVLLAQNFIDDLYEHMGFHPPWKYEAVIELIFEHGILKQEADRQMPTSEQIRRFVERSFDRRYRL